MELSDATTTSPLQRRANPSADSKSDEIRVWGERADRDDDSAPAALRRLIPIHGGVCGSFTNANRCDKAQSLNANSENRTRFGAKITSCWSLLKVSASLDNSLGRITAKMRCQISRNQNYFTQSQPPLNILGGSDPLLCDAIDHLVYLRYLSSVPGAPTLQLVSNSPSLHSALIPRDRHHSCNSRKSQSEAPVFGYNTVVPSLINPVRTANSKNSSSISQLSHESRRMATRGVPKRWSFGYSRRSLSST